MTKEEMLEGLNKGRRLVQEEWSTPSEIRSVDELIEEGKAIATQWTYRDNFQCNVRFIIGK